MGPERVARLMVAVTRKHAKRGRPWRTAKVNGQPGLIRFDPDGRVSDVLTVDVLDNVIQAVRIVRNPDKLPRSLP